MKTKKIIIFLIIILLVFSSFPDVYADGRIRDGDFIYDFEDDSVSDNPVSDGNFNISGTDNAEVDNSPTYEGSRSWRGGIAGDSSNTNITFYSTHPEVFWYQYFDDGGFSTYVNMYNDENIQIIRIRIDHSAHDLTVYDHEHAGHVLNNGLNYDVWDFFRVSMNATDEVFYQFYDNNDGWFNATYTPYTIDDNFNISYVKFQRSGSGNGYNLDNIGYNDIPEAQEDYFDFEDTLSICANPLNGYVNIKDDKYIEHETESPFSGTIKHILLPISQEQYGLVSMNANDYFCKLNDFTVGPADYIQPYGGEYAVIWSDINAGLGYNFNNEQVVFSFGCTQYVAFPYVDYYWYGVGVAWAGLGKTMTHDANNLYNDGVLSGSTDEIGNLKLTVCWYYDNGGISQPEPVPSIDLINLYTDSYAENGTIGWLEFYKWFQDCFHHIGDHPYIIYNLTGNNTGGLKTYRVNLVKTGDNRDFVYTTLISISVEYKTAYYQLPDYIFTETGQYYWQVYNTTDYGLTLGNLVYTSRNIYVCKEIGSGETDTDILPLIPQPLGSIVGLLIILFCLLAPLLIGIGVQKNTGVSIRIPTFVFAISGGTGIAVTVILKLFPKWVPFFIIALGIISIVGAYILNLREQGVL